MSSAYPQLLGDYIGKGIVGGEMETCAEVRLIERVQAHYEVQHVEMGTVYRWYPESLVVDCSCGEEMTLIASAIACIECGEDHTAFVAEVLDVVRPGEKEVDHPWRLVRPYYRPTRGT